MTAAALTFVFATASESRAQVDLSMGGNFWYNSWTPAWHKGWMENYATNDSGKSRYQFGDHPDFKSNWIPLYGPVFSMRFFNSISVSTVFMYGRAKYDSTGLNMFEIVRLDAVKIPTVHFGYINHRRNVKKFDSDTTVSFAVTEYFSVIAGYKYQGYDYIEKGHYVNIDAVGISSDKKKRNSSSGPGLGVGLNMHLFDALYLQIAMSGLFLWGKEKTSSSYIINTAGELSYWWGRSGSNIAYGGTGSAGFAYKTPAGITLSLGFRGQILKYGQLNRDVSFERFKGKHDLFYGLTFSAVYTVSFGREKNENSGDGV
jgi:hypothetical protein